MISIVNANRASSTTISRLIASALVLTVVALVPSRASAQVTFSTASLVEWNGPAPGDIGPGAVSINNGQLWYVTRFGNPGTPPRVIPFQPGIPLDTTDG